MGRHFVPGLNWNAKTKEARFDFRTSDRARHRRAPVKFSSHEAARVALETLRDELEQEIARDDKQTAPSSFVDVEFARFVEDVLPVLATRWAKTTERQNRYAIQRYLVPFFGDRRLADIDDAAVAEWLRRMQEGSLPSLTKPLNATSVNFSLKLLRLLLNTAKKEAQRRGVNLVPPEIACLAEERLSLEMDKSEHSAFLAAFDDWEAFRQDCHLEKGSRSGLGERRVAALFEHFHSSKELFVVALDTGLRSSDLLSLSWKSVDLNERSITLRQRKTKEDVHIPLTHRAHEALRTLRARKTVNPTFVFTSARTGRRFARKTFERHFARAKRLAGITRRLRPHDMRHTFGSDLVSGNVSLTTVQKLMGHRDPKTTLRYARPNRDALRAGIDTLNERHPSSGTTTDAAEAKR